MEKIADNIIKTYTVSELIERYTQLLMSNEELQKENQELRRQLENKETPETPETITKPVQPDYEEVKDNNGRIWYKRTHLNAQRKESRLLKKYDVIISNPPYIAEDEEVDPQTKYEPKMALYAKHDGLEFYEHIIKNAKNMLQEKSILAFEIGCTQGDYLVEFAKDYFPNAIISIEQDLYERDRYLFIINE